MNEEETESDRLKAIIKRAQTRFFQNGTDHHAANGMLEILNEADPAEYDLKKSPTPSRYQWEWKGVTFDFYRLCEILGIKCHPQAHALKKVIRAGRSIKALEQDIDEAIDALKRWKEMILEEKSMNATPDPHDHH